MEDDMWSRMTLEDPWDTGELGRDEEFVKVVQLSDEQEKVMNEYGADKVDWSNAPEEAQFFSAFCFRQHVNGDEYYWEDGIDNDWVLGNYESIEVHQRDYHDFQMRPVITPERMDEILAETLVESTESVVVDTPAPLGAVKYEGRKWWNSEGQMWDNVHEEWIKPADDTPIKRRTALKELRERPNVAIFGEKKTNKTSIDFLEEVKSVQSQRAAEYEQDGGERSFDKVAIVFNTYTGMELQPSHVALMLEILKNVRFYAQDGYHSDSVVDKISYGSLWAELVTKERQNDN